MGLRDCISFMAQSRSSSGSLMHTRGTCWWFNMNWRSCSAWMQTFWMYTRTSLTLAAGPTRDSKYALKNFLQVTSKAGFVWNCTNFTSNKPAISTTALVMMAIRCANKWLTDLPANNRHHYTQVLLSHQHLSSARFWERDRYINCTSYNLFVAPNNCRLKEEEIVKKHVYKVTGLFWDLVDKSALQIWNCWHWQSHCAMHDCHHTCSHSEGIPQTPLVLIHSYRQCAQEKLRYQEIIHCDFLIVLYKTIDINYDKHLCTLPLKYKDKEYKELKGIQSKFWQAEKIQGETNGSSKQSTFSSHTTRTKIKQKTQCKLFGWYHLL